MHLKDELEIIRGKPIMMIPHDPADVPCMEISDKDALCKAPLVSVQMATYNHERYIRRAIESVLEQKTDFPFELVIGEDCSQDKTRDICIEYQKRYPDKIRVLWWHENVRKLGGNSRRIAARCRGKYIAVCEGDDFWVSPQKLQKQVNILERNPSVGLCFTDGRIVCQNSDKNLLWHDLHDISAGKIEGRKFCVLHAFGESIKREPSPLTINTASAVYRRDIWMLAFERFEIFRWDLALGDSTLWLGLASLADVWYLADVTMCYNQNSGGAMHQYGCSVVRDAQIVRMYYAFTYLHVKPVHWPVWFLDAVVHYYILNHKDKRWSTRVFESMKLISSKRMRYVFLRPRCLPVTICICLGLPCGRFFELVGRFEKCVRHVIQKVRGRFS